MRTLSADWVVPVEGDPIPDGAVAIADDGLIAAVGTREDLGEGEHFDEAVILPGFVNAHSHTFQRVMRGRVWLWRFWAWRETITGAPTRALEVKRAAETVASRRS